MLTLVTKQGRKFSNVSSINPTQTRVVQPNLNVTRTNQFKLVLVLVWDVRVGGGSSWVQVGVLSLGLGMGCVGKTKN